MGARKMNRSKPSGNYRILRNILSKTRQIDVSPEISYLVVYSFLYKYCSDLLKDYFLSVIEDKEITLDEAYANEMCLDVLRRDAFNMFGYHITGSEYFMDEVMGSSYSDRFFIHEFFEAFSKHVEFPKDSNYDKYFSFIFDAVSHEINMNKFEFEGENHLIVKDIIYSISKLDVMDEAYPYEKVFDMICESNLVKIEHDPDYISHILSAIVSSAKNEVADVYNPFLRDGSLLIDLKRYCGRDMKNSFAKSFDKLTFCSGMVRLYLNNFDLDSVFAEYGSPFESVDIKSASFDVIISRIPPITPRNLKKLNRTQNIKMAKRSKRKQLQDILSTEFDMNRESFLSDGELNDAVENLLSKMDLERDFEREFSGEYESLKDSEYLFLINLIDCLKDGGMMALSMSQGFLFKNSLEKLRKYLTVERNYIDAIISIPDELSRPKRSEIIVIFSKDRNMDNILFIDTSSDFALKRSSNAMPGMFKKNLLLDDDTLGRVIDVYMKRKTVDRFSNVVSLGEIEKNEFNLSISRYVDTFEGEFIRLEDMKSQREEIYSSIENLNKKIDMMMDELNIRF